MFDFRIFFPVIGTNGNESTSINQFQHQEEIQNGSMKQYQFRNRTRLQFEGNVTTLLNVTCDADEIGDQNLTIQYHAENEVAIQLQLNATNSGLNLTNQHRIQTQNNMLYQFKYLIVCNLSRNTTDNMITTLRLRIQDQDRNSTWAWYNETSEIFETIPSVYINGELIANTTHYSTYVVLTGLTTSTNIWLHLIIIVALVGFGFYIIVKPIMKKSKQKPI